MPETTGLPEFHSLGVLKDFDYDVALQSIAVTLSDSLVNGIERPVEVRGSFAGVCYLQLISDLPVSFAENDMDVFEEREPSELLEGLIMQKDGWTYLASDLDNAVIGTPAKSAPSLRHFVLKSSTVSGEWVCSSAWFGTDDEPLE